MKPVTPWTTMKPVTPWTTTDRKRKNKEEQILRIPTTDFAYSEPNLF